MFNPNKNNIQTQEKWELNQEKNNSPTATTVTSKYKNVFFIILIVCFLSSNYYFQDNRLWESIAKVSQSSGEGPWGYNIFSIS